MLKSYIQDEYILPKKKIPNWTGNSFIFSYSTISVLLNKQSCYDVPFLLDCGYIHTHTLYIRILEIVIYSLNS